MWRQNIPPSEVARDRVGALAVEDPFDDLFENRFLLLVEDGFSFARVVLVFDPPVAEFVEAGVPRLSLFYPLDLAAARPVEDVVGLARGLLAFEEDLYLAGEGRGVDVVEDEENVSFPLVELAQHTKYVIALTAAEEPVLSVAVNLLPPGRR